MYEDGVVRPPDDVRVIVGPHHPVLSPWLRGVAQSSGGSRGEPGGAWVGRAPHHPQRLLVERVLQWSHRLRHPGGLGLTTVQGAGQGVELLGWGGGGGRLLHQQHLPAGEGRTHWGVVEGGELTSSLVGGVGVTSSSSSSSSSSSPASGHFLQSPDAQGQSLLVAQSVETSVLPGEIIISCRDWNTMMLENALKTLVLDIDIPWG